jgi:hypothetical protein
VFNNHQPLIGSWARQSPRNFANVGLFVQLTIRVPLIRAVEDVKRYQEGDWSPLFAFKLDAVKAFEREAEARLYALEKDIGDRDAQLLTAASWLGFGPVKGGFLLQLVYGVSGCLDSHNIRRLGINPRMFDAHRFKKGRLRTRIRMVKEYHQIVDAAGGTQELWDDWCDAIAESNRHTWNDGTEVSKAHALACINDGSLDTGEPIPF